MNQCVSRHRACPSAVVTMANRPAGKSTGGFRWVLGQRPCPALPYRAVPDGHTGRDHRAPSASQPSRSGAKALQFPLASDFAATIRFPPSALRKYTQQLA
jgi:hypothetical protein